MRDDLLYGIRAPSKSPYPYGSYESLLRSSHKISIRDQYSTSVKGVCSAFAASMTDGISARNLSTSSSLL